MRLKGFAVAVIALAAMLSSTVSATASPSSRAIDSANCTQATSTRAADRCVNIGSVFDWDIVAVSPGVYLLIRRETGRCLSTNGHEVYEAKCSGGRHQLWFETTEGQGAREFHNIEYRYVCVFAYVAPDRDSA